jgi:hypothetical protein
MPYVQLLGLAAADTARVFNRRVGAGEERPALLEQGTPAIGELDMPSAALEQSHPEFSLELANRRAKRLLAHVKPCRGVREVELLCDGDEMAQLAEVESHGLRRS